MKEVFLRRILNEGIVDTRKWRYVVEFDAGCMKVKRCPREWLDTAFALGEWETVLVKGEKR